MHGGYVRTAGAGSVSWGVVTCMSINRSRWRASMAKWQRDLARRRASIANGDGARLIAAMYVRLRKLFLPAIASAAQISILIFFREFFEPFSPLFWIALACTVIIFAIFVAKYYLASALALLVFVSFVAVTALRAPYQIASDQSRLRYRTVEGTSYFEFPEGITILKSIAKLFAGHELIVLEKCDDMKVATLPLLPYEPLFLENNMIDTTGFRRLPYLQIEKVDLNITASVDHIQSNGAPHGSIGLQVGFSTNDRARIPLTWIFPRSIKCKPHNVPLIPVLEVLPWNPGETSALINAVTRVDQLRQAYPEHSVSLDILRKLHIDNDSTYSALLDFVTYSMIYQMFDGNIFAQTRAHVGNTLCTLVDGHQSAFSTSGPFSAFQENLMRRMVAEFGSNVRLVAPACDVSEDLVQSYQKSTSTSEAWPFITTFRDCLKTPGSMTQCLAKDDAPAPRPGCEGIACSMPTPPALPGEAVLEIYDAKSFYDIVATKEKKLVSIEGIEPSECPNLRNKEENGHFVEWWIEHAREFAAEPIQCLSSAWLKKYDQRKSELQQALLCAKERDIQYVLPRDDGPEMMDLQSDTRCSRNFDIEKLRMANPIVRLFYELDPLIDMLKRYSDLISASESKSLIRSFQMLAGIKEQVCGTQDLQGCMDDDTASQNYQRLINRFVEGHGLSDTGSSAAEFVNALTKLDNVLVDMAVCDALQDEELSKRSGIDRTIYCDKHGLAEYRLAGSEPVGHSIERGDEGDPGFSYRFESNGPDKRYEILKFLDSQPRGQ
jgi:hypothetical protein